MSKTQKVTSTTDTDNNILEDLKKLILSLKPQIKPKPRFNPTNLRKQVLDVLRALSISPSVSPAVTTPTTIPVSTLQALIQQTINTLSTIPKPPTPPETTFHAVLPESSLPELIQQSVDTLNTIVGQPPVPEPVKSPTPEPAEPIVHSSLIENTIDVLNNLSKVPDIQYPSATTTLPISSFPVLIQQTVNMLNSIRHPPAGTQTPPSIEPVETGVPPSLLETTLDVLNSFPPKMPERYNVSEIRRISKEILNLIVSPLPAPAVSQTGVVVSNNISELISLANQVLHGTKPAVATEVAPTVAPAVAPIIPSNLFDITQTTLDALNIKPDVGTPPPEPVGLIDTLGDLVTQAKDVLDSIHAPLLPKPVTPIITGVPESSLGDLVTQAKDVLDSIQTPTPEPINVVVAPVVDSLEELIKQVIQTLGAIGHPPIGTQITPSIQLVEPVIPSSLIETTMDVLNSFYEIPKRYNVSEIRRISNEILNILNIPPVPKPETIVTGVPATSLGDLIIQSNDVLDSFQTPLVGTPPPTTTITIGEPSSSLGDLIVQSKDVLDSFQTPLVGTSTTPTITTGVPASSLGDLIVQSKDVLDSFQTPSIGTPPPTTTITGVPATSLGDLVTQAKDVLDSIQTPVVGTPPPTTTITGVPASSLGDLVTQAKDVLDSIQTPSIGTPPPTTTIVTRVPASSLGDLIVQSKDVLDSFQTPLVGTPTTPIITVGVPSSSLGDLVTQAKDVLDSIKTPEQKPLVGTPVVVPVSSLPELILKSIEVIQNIIQPPVVPSPIVTPIVPPPIVPPSPIVPAVVEDMGDAIITIYETNSDDKEKTDMIESTNIRFDADKGEIQVGEPKQKTTVRPITGGGGGDNDTPDSIVTSESKQSESKPSESKQSETKQSESKPSESNTHTQRYVYDNKTARINEIFSKSAGGGITELDALMYKAVSEKPSIYKYDGKSKGDKIVRVLVK